MADEIITIITDHLPARITSTEPAIIMAEIVEVDPIETTIIETKVNVLPAGPVEVVVNVTEPSSVNVTIINNVTVVK